MATSITTRLERSLRLTAYEASLHATGREQRLLDYLLDEHANARLSTRDARAAVIALRAEQQHRDRAAA